MQFKPTLYVTVNKKLYTFFWYLSIMSKSLFIAHEDFGLIQTFKVGMFLNEFSRYLPKASCTLHLLTLLTNTKKYIIHKN